MQKHHNNRIIKAFPESVFPSKKFCVMKFTRQLGLATGVTQYAFGTNALFRLNNIYQPRVSGALQRAQGWNYLSGIYGKYKVYGAKVNITFSNPSQDGLVCAIRPAQHDNTDYVSLETVSAAGQKRWTVLKPINDSGSQVSRYSRYFDIGAMQGLTKSQFNADNDKFCSALNAGPATSPYIEVSCANTKDTTDANIMVAVSIEFYVQLYDRQVLQTPTI
jgi:hypothetical protein